MKQRNRYLKLSATPKQAGPMRFYREPASHSLNLNDFATPITMNGKADKVAQDAALAPLAQMFQGAQCGGSGFVGYPTLSLLAQDGLIRAGVETIADDMTKKWIELSRKGDKADANNDGEDDRVAKLTEVTERYKLQSLFNEAAQLCGYFGGCLAFIDMGHGLDDSMLKNPLVVGEDTFKPDDFRGFKLIEPVNVSPGTYSGVNPLAEDYFTPQTWRIQGHEIHRSRFLYFVDNEPPQMLKPLYNFFGIPQAQIALDYVNGFSQSRAEALRLLQKFSTMIVKSNLSDLLTGGGTQDIERRMQYMVETRGNDGVALIDMETEDIVELATPLAGVTDIVRQALEFLAAIFRIPAVKFLGVTPGGLNATGQADIDNYYDYIASQQEKQLRRPLSRALDVCQMVAFGKIDPAISFSFVPLAEEDQTAKMQRLSLFAQAITALGQLGANAVSNVEIRAALNELPDSPFGTLDVEDLPQETGFVEPGLEDVSGLSGEKEETPNGSAL